MIGDLTHHPVLLAENPAMHFAYDLDPAAAVESRKRTLTMLAEERIRLFACHFPWPGLGHVAAQGEGFRYFPEEIQW